DNKAFQRSWVHSKLGDWVDARSLLATDLAFWTQAWTVESGQGVLTLGLPIGASAASGTACGVVLDLGQSDAKRVILKISGGGAPVGWQVLLRAGDSVVGAGVSTVAADESYTLANGLPTTTTIYRQTLTSNRRYLQILLVNNSGVTGNGAASTFIRVESAQIFRSTAYESGDASILTADVPIKDVLAFCPLLSTDTSQIQAGSFQIPDFAPDGAKTPREIVDAANAFENWITMVDEQFRLVFKAKPSAAAAANGARSGMSFQDGSSNSLAE